MSNRKQSVLMGGLISSAGIFLSKFLGLLYVVPFNVILQTAENQSYYSQTYNIYSYILNIATAGLPFAIATLVAKYATRDDYRTCLLVKKISFITMATFGFICMLLMILFSSMIANQVCPNDGDINIMRNSILLISFAVFIVPILSSLRGFYQGLKEMEIYSISQVLEQLARIIFLLSIGAIIVFVFHQDAVWAVYFAILAASISAVLTIFFIRWKGKLKYHEIIEKSKHQELETKADAKEIFKELLYVAIPYLIISIFGYSDTIINQMDLKPGLEAYGKMEFSAGLSSAIFYSATKVIAIPMILAPGFSAAIIPYITSAMEKKKGKLVRKYILDCVESVIYIALPICFALFVFARPIMFTLFGNGNLEMNTFVLKWYALEALCATICPIFSSIVTAIGLRKKIVANTVVFSLIKIACNRLFISLWGVGGMVLSSFVAYLVFTLLNLHSIQKYCHVNWKYTFRKLLIMALGLALFYLLSIPFDYLGWIAMNQNRMISLFCLALMGIVCCGGYIGLTSICSIPQSIFHFQFSDIINKIKNRGIRS